MTREELVQMREYKVAQASTEYWKKNMGNDEISIMTAFEDGVAWADKHEKNPWISVEERLPEKNCIVFVSLDGTEYLSAHYRVKSKRFVTVNKDKQTLVEVRKSAATYTVCGDCIKEERLYSEGQREDITSLVTHWMPIPELKEE